MARICLITPHHVSFQPRTLREADLLSARGHDVRVVSRQCDPELTQFDLALMSGRKWRLQVVDVRRNGIHAWRWLWMGGATKLARWGFDRGLRWSWVAESAYMPGLQAVCSIAGSEPADWFIAHTQGALPAAAAGVKRWGGRLGFDCEDLLTEADSNPPKIVQHIESTYLARCDYITVPSEAIASFLVSRYGVCSPVVLHNVFPISLSAGLQEPVKRTLSLPLRVHWFGQTIGPGRGIEDAIESMAELGSQAELHLRGRIGDSYRDGLMKLVAERGVQAQIHFAPLVAPERLMRTMDRYDVGLALERSDHENCRRTISNKIFNYLMAGLAIAATDTPGQRELLNRIPSVGFLYPSGRPEELARILQNYIENPDLLRDAQRASWKVARESYCWDREQDKLLRILDN